MNTSSAHPHYCLFAIPLTSKLTSLNPLLWSFMACSVH